MACRCLFIADCHGVMELLSHVPSNHSSLFSNLFSIFFSASLVLSLVNVHLFFKVVVSSRLVSAQLASHRASSHQSDNTPCFYCWVPAFFEAMTTRIGE